MSCAAITQSGDIAVITFTRPPVNAVDLDFVTDMERCLAEAKDSAQYQAVVLTGHGTC